MPSPVPFRSRALRAMAGAFVLAGAVAAQKAVAEDSLAIRASADVTFDLLASAPFRHSYRAVQVRRFLDEHGNLAQVREQLTVDGDGTTASVFALEFVDTIPASTGPEERSRWKIVYSANAGLLHSHGGFRVRDVVAAQRNYTLHDFGSATRANRSVRRTVVFPNRIDKAIWVLDLDVRTGIPLYSAEYDSNARLIGELEVTSFVEDFQVAKLPTGWQWKPRLSVSEHPTIEAAASRARDCAVVAPLIAGIMPEYGLHKIQVAENPLNGDQTIVLGYTDGVDEFFVLEAIGGLDPFAGSALMRDPAGRRMQAIATYDDPGMRVYVFREAGITFQIVGRSSLARLRNVAMRLLQQVVTGR